MSDDLETLVRRSLDAVDRSRRTAAIITGILFVVIVFPLGFQIARSPGGSKVMWVSAAAQMAFVGICTSLLAGHITRMTKAIVRAIELSTKKQ